MAQTTTGSQMHLAIIIEENEQGFHREMIWFGATPGNLGLMLIDVMKDWYEPHIDELDPSIVKFHKMLEDSENLTFNKLAGEAYNANGMKLFVDLTYDINVIFNFVVNEICSIFAKDGETAGSFPSLAAFREHFTRRYELDEDLQKVLETVNAATISKALVLLDMKYKFTERHTILPE